MSGKNLTFKLVMEGDNKGLVASAKQSEQVVSKVFETIKQEANRTRSATNSATQGIDQLGKESTTTAIEVKKLDAELAQTNIELAKTDDVATEATKGIQGLKTGYNALAGAMAALGIGVTASELANQADAYKNLTARIQIAVGEHGNIQKAMDDVVAVSLKTNANLEATGGLYARLTKIGQEMKWPQEQALKLTEAINKAVAVGGGSAASNEAALTQLNQALGSGVLRGDEFNSIMEQSPRLAQAMADGLGVTTGKLREMAGEGKLTSDVVTKAILSQSDTITKEFDKFPTTIGNSIENLKTSWMVYLGELDKTHGVSEKAANAIKYLAENLDQVVGTLTLAGQAFIAYKALNIASVFLDKAAGVRAASVALTQETTAVVANTQAQLANATATRSASLAKTQLATNAQVATTATVATSGSIMTLIGRLGALGVAVTAAGLLIPTVFKPIGEWAGESLAKLNEYIETLDKLDKQKVSGEETYYTDTISASQKYEFQLANETARTKAAAEVKASFAKAAQEATDKTYGLNAESKKLISGFDGLIKKGEPTKDALEKISNAMKFDSTKGINDAVTALNLLKDQGKITGDEIQAELLKALNGKDLVVFQTNAKAAFAGTAQEAAKTAAMTEAVMTAALSRTGLETQQLQGRFSGTFQSASNDVQIVIDNLEAYKAKGIDTGLALSTNLNNAINTAQTGAELDYAKAKLVDLSKQGLITGEQVALGLSKIEQKANQLPDALNPVQAAFNALGIKTQEQLDNTAASAQANFEAIKNSGKATADGIKQAYTSALNAVIATGDRAKIATMEAKAYSLGLEVQMDKTGKATVAKFGEMQKAAEDTQRVIQETSKTEPTNNPNSKPQEEDHWTDFKAKQKAKTDERNRLANSAKRINPTTANVASEINNPVVAELAPLITTAFSTQATENIQPKETKRLELAIGDQTAELEGTPQNVDIVDQLFAQLESSRKRR